MFYIDIGSAPEDQELLFLENEQAVQEFQERFAECGEIHVTKVESIVIPEKVRFFVTWYERTRHDVGVWYVTFSLEPLKEDEKGEVIANELERFRVKIIGNTAKEALEKAQEIFAKRKITFVEFKK